MRLAFWRRKHVDLLVIRLADMVRVHPAQDNDFSCDSCGEQVGIYPSGQEVIRRYGSRRVRITCSICFGPGWSSMQPAPGVADEMRQSIVKAGRVKG